VYAQGDHFLSRFWSRLAPHGALLGSRSLSKMTHPRADNSPGASLSLCGDVTSVKWPVLAAKPLFPGSNPGAASNSFASVRGKSSLDTGSVLLNDPTQ